ncbi:peptidase S8/S53 domain-containing protein [Fimicolochytrium jonesii]|uniref:peptidase S8/S53 domain-containing protein n=1 Tax=Fimicolochytrium jonesii TaxID=1396493 RepID=UPI0022FE93DD|nr:peptidase S8/S53 domain-containing protein [Fimicolochytrium jonesii]KAI8816655.1 peptidase S8/S53 domain-containing protein [Fimicolochytrium jonesii]
MLSQLSFLVGYWCLGLVSVVVHASPLASVTTAWGTRALYDKGITDRFDEGSDTVSVLVQIRDVLNPSAFAKSSGQVVDSTAFYEGLGRHSKDSSLGVQALLRDLSAEFTYSHHFRLSNTYVIDASRRLVEALVQLPEVYSIRRNAAFRVNDKERSTGAVSSFSNKDGGSGVSWNANAIGAAESWAKGLNGTGLLFASADSGVTWEHPALKSNYLAVGSNGIGIAPGASWMACRNMYNGVGRPEYYLACLEFFLAPTDVNGKNPDPARRPHVINNSYGCTSAEFCDQFTFKAAVGALTAAGVLMVASAGNSALSSADTCKSVVNPPAIDARVISVGSLRQSGLIYETSSRGSVPGRGPTHRGVDISAPGVMIRGAIPPAAYAQRTGTSMAASHIAASALIVLQACPHLLRRTVDVGATLQQTAFPLTTTDGCNGDKNDTIPNSTYGYGKVNVTAAVLRCQD